MSLFLYRVKIGAPPRARNGWRRMMDGVRAPYIIFFSPFQQIHTPFMPSFGLMNFKTINTHTHNHLIGFARIILHSGFFFVAILVQCSALSALGAGFKCKLVLTKVCVCEEWWKGARKENRLHACMAWMHACALKHERYVKYNVLFIAGRMGLVRKIYRANLLKAIKINIYHTRYSYLYGCRHAHWASIHLFISALFSVSYLVCTRRSHCTLCAHDFFSFYARVPCELWMYLN